MVLKLFCIGTDVADTVQDKLPVNLVNHINFGMLGNLKFVVYISNEMNEQTFLAARKEALTILKKIDGVKVFFEYNELEKIYIFKYSSFRFAQKT